MKKGITPIIGVLIAVTITIVVSGVFFYWATNIQRGAQGNSQLATKNFLSQTLLRGGELVDAYYTTIEEKDILAYSDFKTNFCNNGQTSLDMTGTKSIQLEEESSGNIICAEDVLTNGCLETTSYIIGGLSGSGSDTPLSGSSASIVSSTDGTTWNEVAGVDTSGGQTDTDENIYEFAQWSVDSVDGESPTNLWAAVHHDEVGEQKGRLAFTEDFSNWQFQNILTNQPITAVSRYVGSNKLFVGADGNQFNVGAEVFEVVATETSQGTSISFARPSEIIGSDIYSHQNLSSVYALYTEDSTFLAGTGNDSTTSVYSTGLIYKASNSNWASTIAVDTPDNYTRINDFEGTATRIYAATTGGPSLVDSTTDVIYSTDAGLSWTSTGLTTGTSNPGALTLLDDPEDTGDNVYVGLSISGGFGIKFGHIYYYNTSTSSWSLVHTFGSPTYIYDLAADTNTQYFYAAIGNFSTGSERAEIWRSGPNWNDTNWTLVYQNPYRGQTSALKIATRCNKQNPVCVSGCDAVLQPGECTDLQIALEGSACEISSFAPESQFKLTFNLGSFFTKVFHFKKNQNPAQSTSNGTYISGATPPAGPLTLNKVLLNSTDITTNDTIENLTAYLNISNAESYTFTKIYDWRVNYTSIATLNMPFDNQSTSFVKDYSTWKNNGTATSITWNNAATCKLNSTSGGCYYFDGSTSYILVPDSPGLSSTNLTIEAWINLTDTVTSRDNTIMGKRDITNADNGVYYLQVSEQNTDGLVRFTAYDSTCIGGGIHRTTLSGTTNVLDKTWHQVVAVVNDSHMVIYVDGAVDASQSYAGGVCTGRSDDLYIGAKGHHITNFFEGYMDNLRIYNRSLSPKQILTNYNQGSPRYNLTHNNETCGGDEWFVATTLSQGTSDGETMLSNGVNITGAGGCASGGGGFGGSCVLTPSCDATCGSTGYSNDGGITCYSDPSCTSVCFFGG